MKNKSKNSKTRANRRRVFALSSNVKIILSYKRPKKPFQILSTPINIKVKKRKVKPKVLKIILDLRNVLSLSLIILGLGIGIFSFGKQAGNITVVDSTSSFQQIHIPAPDSSRVQSTSSSLPKKLLIPSIKVDAKFDIVGQLADGTLQTPNVLSGDVGWYDQSPLPGQTGPSIVVGHVDSYEGPSVFWNLHKLHDGDEIQIQMEDGSAVNFVVTEVRQFDQSNFPTDTVYGDIDHAGLRLITCGGIFDREAGHYLKNTVVFARLKV